MISTRSTRGRSTLRLVAPVTGLALLLAACSTTGGGASSPAASAAPAASEAPAASGTPLEGTNWQLTDYAGPEGNTIPVPAAAVATALLEGGRVSGNSGCNTYTGSYTLDGDKITIGPLTTTMMACGDVQMALETAFTTAMGKVATWSITGDTLELRTAEGTVGLKFAATEAPALTGTQWFANGINNGQGGVQSLAAGTEVTATFGDDGRVMGSGGCNTYSGSYTVDGAKIKIGPIASTKMACEGDAGTQETAYFMALEKATTFDFVAGRLELRDDGGSLQVSYQETKP